MPSRQLIVYVLPQMRRNKIPTFTRYTGRTRFNSKLALRRYSLQLEVIASFYFPHGLAYLQDGIKIFPVVDLDRIA